MTPEVQIEQMQTIINQQTAIIDRLLKSAELAEEPKIEWGGPAYPYWVSDESKLAQEWDDSKGNPFDQWDKEEPSVVDNPPAQKQKFEFPLALVLVLLIAASMACVCVIPSMG